MNAWWQFLLEGEATIIHLNSSAHGLDLSFSIFCLNIFEFGVEVFVRGGGGGGQK